MVGDFDDQGGRAEHLFLKPLIAVDQQADIGLEQLRPCLAALLRAAGQVRDAGMRVQVFQALAITVQGADVEHGLRRLLSDQRAQTLHKVTELR
ncbi:hypothetical protein D3C76_1529250 [compost metagenome]